MSRCQTQDRHARPKEANMYHLNTNNAGIQRMAKRTFDVAIGSSEPSEPPESGQDQVPVEGMVVELVGGTPGTKKDESSSEPLAKIASGMDINGYLAFPDTTKVRAINDTFIEVSESTTEPLAENSTETKVSKETAAVSKPEMAINAERRRLTQKIMRMFQTNSIISIHNGDQLLRVALAETLPFMCTLCGETYAHTRLLQVHAERSHGYFQSLVDESEPRKKPVIIARNFGKKDEAKGTPKKDPTNSHAVKRSRKEEPDNNDILEDKLAEVPLSSSVYESSTDKATTGTSEPSVSCIERGVGDILCKIAAHSETRSKKRLRKSSAKETKTKEEAHPSTTTQDRGEAGGKRLKKNKRMRKNGSKKDKYDVIDGDQNVRNFEDKKRKSKKTLSLHCIICHLSCLAKSYKAHLAEAHSIFASREAAEEAMRKRMKQGETCELTDSDVQGDMDIGKKLEKGRREVKDIHCGLNSSYGCDNHSSDKLEFQTNLLTEDIIKCDLCESYVLDERTLKKHMRAHCGMPRIKCDICMEGIRLWENNQWDKMQDLSERYLSKERRPQDVDFKSSVPTPSYPNSRVISTCYECNEQFYFRFHMTNHYSKAHSSLTCKECGENLPNMMALCKHSVKKHPPGIFRCQWCPRRVHDLGRLNFHMQGHLGMNKCSGCGRTFIEKRALDYHLKKYADCPEHFTKSAGGPSIEMEDDQKKAFSMIVCELCNATFVNKGRFERHMTSVHMEQIGTVSEDHKFICETCGGTFSTDNYLKMHMKIHNKKFPCTYSGCTKRFTAPGMLRAHIETHKVIPTWVCDDCGKTFQHSGSLRFHKRTHTKRKNKCKICNNLFPGRANLSDHMKEVHSVELNFTCGVCEEQFASRELLLAHANVHSERSIEFPCSKCPCAFGEAHHLAQHQISFHNKKSYYCAACDKSFRRLDFLKQHHLKEHNNHRSTDPATCQSYSQQSLQIEVQEQIDVQEQIVVHEQIEVQEQIEIQDSQNLESLVIVEYPIHETTDQAIVDMVAELQGQQQIAHIAT